MQILRFDIGLLCRFKQLSIFFHHDLVHLLHGIGAIIIEPSGDDGAESVDKERRFIVAGDVIAFGLETSAELLSVGFYIVKHSSEILGGIAQLGDGCIVREHFQDGIFDFTFHIRSSLHQLIGKSNDLGCERLALCLYDSVIDRIGKACKNAADHAYNNADDHSYISV